MQKYDHHPNRKVGEHWRNITPRRAIDCTGTEICRGRTGFPQPDRDHSLEHLFARRPALIKQIAEKRPLRENNCTSPCCLSAIARQPSNLISYCQSSPAGRVSTDLQSIGRDDKYFLLHFLHHQSMAGFAGAACCETAGSFGRDIGKRGEVMASKRRRGQGDRGDVKRGGDRKSVV